MSSARVRGLPVAHELEQGAGAAWWPVGEVEPAGAGWWRLTRAHVVVKHMTAISVTGANR